MREISEHQSRPELASGERFRVTYRLEGDENEALARAKDICLEQTVEFPDDLVPDGFIRDSVLGKIESFEKESEGYIAIISFPAETAAGEFTQLLNVIFGNISIKPGIFVRDLDLSPSLFKIFKGPRFGVAGLREHLGVASRPLLATALKPMGLTSEGLASLAYKFALGGIDLIKDDHGLTDQPYAPFRERVARCAEAVELANRETGMRCLYVANVTAPSGEIMERAAIAKDAGAGGAPHRPGHHGTRRHEAPGGELHHRPARHQPPGPAGKFRHGRERYVALIPLRHARPPGRRRCFHLPELRRTLLVFARGVQKHRRRMFVQPWAPSPPSSRPRAAA